ncbi:DNA mismatch repair endonuclease MutL [Peptoniphilus sp.]|jgi:DNA mismatch repair protein MutL|uniref:DNA mismatch repair endonuclease MutL n=1 Tax=Peptoniphilus sp. TaxID=1971214 RepID=UPI003D8F7250
MRIALLDDVTISKIAAGEIIENSASIIKELVENSIDAGADKITIEIKGESTNYLKISDNGSGILEDDVENAFLRHSTSKLRDIDDLSKIISLGFRGEALASISTIAKVKLMTKTKDELAGTMAIVENGKVVKKNKIGMPQGTTFIIEDVFYNTPVRKKFLKKDSSEINNIIDIVQKIALSNKNISFDLIKDGKNILSAPATSNYTNRVFSVLGKEMAANLLEGSFESENYKIHGYFSNNKLFRSTRDNQYIFVNGRYVKNLEISRAIESKYRSLIPLNRYPCFVLFLEIPPSLIDVNIHPKKNEIKFNDERTLLALITEVVEDVIYPNRSIREINFEDKKESLNVFDIFGYEEDSEDASDIEVEEKTEDNKETSNDYETSFKESVVSFFPETEESNDYDKSQSDYNVVDAAVNDFKADESDVEVEEASFLEIKDKQIDENILNSRIAGVLFDTYILLEDKDKDTAYIVDQHAAHERVWYERYRRLYLNQEISSQILLKPEIIELNAKEYDKLESHIEIFKDLGFNIEDFGDGAIVLREVPMIFGLPTYVDFIRDIIDSLDKNISSSYEADLYKIMKKACKRAVKANDKLSNIEIEKLIEDLSRCENPYTCPHGRPTIIDVSNKSIAKLFLRE